VTTSAEHVRFTPGSRHGGNCFALVRVRWRPITALNGRQHLKQFGRSDNEEYRSDRTEPASELLRIAIALLGGRLRDPRSSPRAHRWRRSWSCGRGAAAAVAMSELGPSRRFDDVRVMSAFPPIATTERTSRDVSNVPIRDIATHYSRGNEPAGSRRRASFNWMERLSLYAAVFTALVAPICVSIVSMSK
jgi:hypothetical protein